MRTALILLLILVIVGCDSTEKSTDFDRTVSRIFFGSRVTTPFSEQFRYLKTVKELYFDSTSTGWTLYPPLNALGQEAGQVTYHFDFRSHPFAGFKFREATLRLEHHLKKDLRYNCTTSIRFYFDSEKEAETAFEELSSLLASLSTAKAFSSDSLYKTASFANKDARFAKYIDLSVAGEHLPGKSPSVFVRAGNPETEE